VLWAMRNRLVSVALPREPQLPTFKVPDGPIEPDSSAAADEDESDPPQATEPQPDAPSLTDISGIGPVYATRLASAGIHTIEQLAEARAEEVAAAADVPRTRAERWIEAARNARTG
jgi:predicted flap endonuclease-1-like 5' DNA nuclease